jgi:aspartate-semialdehyde dehydrogenase
MLVALKPIYDAVGIARVNVATYQAVSGTGKSAITELAAQTARLLNGQPAQAKVYPSKLHLMRSHRSTLFKKMATPVKK